MKLKWEKKSYCGRVYYDSSTEPCGGFWRIKDNGYYLVYRCDRLDDNGITPKGMVLHATTNTLADAKASIEGAESTPAALESPSTQYAWQRRKDLQ